MSNPHNDNSRQCVDLSKESDSDASSTGGDTKQESNVNKRRRISRSKNNRESKSTSGIAAATAAAVPDNVSSLSRPHLQPVIDNASSSLSYTNDSPPTSNNIESSLHMIGGDDTKNKYTNHKIVQSLLDLRRWARTHDHFRKEFSKLAGIPRVLKFLNVPSNMANMEYVYLICGVICSCINKGQNDENVVIAKAIVSQFVERGGIQLMLLANEEYSGGNDSQQLRAISSIWFAFMRVFMFMSTTAIDKDTLFRIIDDALATLRLMNGVTHKTLVSNIFSAVQNLLVTNHAMIEASDFGTRNFFQTCVDVMHDTDGNWEYNEPVWNKATRLFRICLNDDLFSTENNDNLKLVISFMVEYIKKSPNDAFESHTFKFLHKACDVLDTNVMLNVPGLMSKIGSMLDPITSNGINDETKDAAKALMKKLC